MSAKKTWQLCAARSWRTLSKRAILVRTMNRFLFGGCMIAVLGCGARTQYFEDVDGSGGQLGAGGASATAGAPHGAGAPNAAGAPQFAGAPGIGGAPQFAGAPGIGGAPQFAGAPSVAGAPHVGGGVSVGGAPSFAGAPATAGTGATAGVIEACQVIAGGSCEQCLCKTCSSQIVECFSNFGCALIFACAQQTGCQGISCYSAQTCRPVIDQLGGIGGKAMKGVLSLLTCSATSQNSCSCN